MNAIAWMCRQETTAPLTVSRGPRSRTALFVRRQGGDVVPLSQAQNELRESVLNVLREHGASRISEIRPLLSTDFFVGDTPHAQAAEISGALKVLRQHGTVVSSSVMPYVWTLNSQQSSERTHA